MRSLSLGRERAQLQARSGESTFTFNPQPHSHSPPPLLFLVHFPSLFNNLKLPDCVSWTNLKHCFIVHVLQHHHQTSKPDSRQSLRPSESDVRLLISRRAVLKAFHQNKNRPGPAFHDTTKAEHILSFWLSSVLADAYWLAAVTRSTFLNLREATFVSSGLQTSEPGNPDQAEIFLLLRKPYNQPSLL